jgi:hypothetical protein
MGDRETSPTWLRIWATDLAPGDLIRFRPEGPSIRIIDRDYPGPHTNIFRIRLDSDTSTGLSKTAQVWVHDVDGTVRRRVQMVIEETPA